MALNNDCWLLVLEHLDQETLEHIACLRAASRQLRALCDGIFFKDLEINLDRRRGRTTHYIKRLLNDRDDLRKHLRHLRVSGRVYRDSNLPIFMVLATVLQCLADKAGKGPRLKTLQWHTVTPFPTDMILILQRSFPATKLHIDYDWVRDGRQFPEGLSKHFKMLSSSPNLHSFSACMTTRKTSGNDTVGDDLLTSDLVKTLISNATSLRGLNMVMLRPQDQPYFVIEENEKLPALESLRLDLSRTLHGPSHSDALDIWSERMDWTQLRKLHLEAVSQSQCEAIFTKLESKLPLLQDLSVNIVGSIGPVGTSLMEKFSHFLNNLEHLESLSLIADLPFVADWRRFDLWPSIMKLPKLRRLIHRKPPSFLVSRDSIVHCDTLAYLAKCNLEFLSIDVDLLTGRDWPPKVLDSLALFGKLEKLEIVSHLSSRDFDLLDPVESCKLLETAFRHISSHIKHGQNLRSLEGVFRFDGRKFRTMPDNRGWETRARCVRADELGHLGQTRSVALNDAKYQRELHHILHANSRLAQFGRDWGDSDTQGLDLEPNPKRRRSRQMSFSHVDSFEANAPLIDNYRHSRGNGSG